MFYSTDKKTEAEKNDHKDEQALHKLMNNPVYGKTMVNLRSRIDIRLVSNEKDCLKWTSKPGYISNKTLDNDLVMLSKSKVTLTLNKPAYVGTCTLDVNKVMIYEFHYDYIRNKYDNNSRILFTDTDSLMYEIKTEDVYEDYTCLILVII